VAVFLGNSTMVTGPLLKIKDANIHNHNGTYRCQVSNAFGSFYLDYHLFLNNKPELVIEPKRKVVKKGESFRLNCKLKNDQDSNAEYM